MPSSGKENRKEMDGTQGLLFFSRKPIVLGRSKFQRTQTSCCTGFTETNVPRIRFRLESNLVLRNIATDQTTSTTWSSVTQIRLKVST